MWYFAWILGVTAAAAVGVINVMWYEFQDNPDRDGNEPRLKAARFRRARPGVSPPSARARLLSADDRRRRLSSNKRARRRRGPFGWRWPPPPRAAPCRIRLRLAARGRHRSTRPFHGADAQKLAPALAGLIALVASARWRFAYVRGAAGFAASARARAALFRRLLDHVRALGPVRLADLPTGEKIAVLTDAVAALEPYWRRYLPALATVAALPSPILLAVAAARLARGARVPVCAAGRCFSLILVGKGAERRQPEQWAKSGPARRPSARRRAGPARPEDFSRGESAKSRSSRRMAEAYRRDTMAVLRLAFLSALVLEFFTASGDRAGRRSGRLPPDVGRDRIFTPACSSCCSRRNFTRRCARLASSATPGWRRSRRRRRIVALLDRPAPAPGRALAPAFGEAVGVRFENVGFCYDGGRPGARRSRTSTLRRASMSRGRAERRAARALFFRFCSASSQPTRGPDSGRWPELADIDLARWRRQIAHMPQRAASVRRRRRAKCRHGPGAAGGDVRSAIARALREARAQTAVAGLPHGARTRLGEGGLGLSGGEAQRVALARAFFQPAPLVLFDEPTAHLDPATERELQAALARLVHGRT